MQGPDKNMLDVSDKIAVFIKKLSLSLKDIENVSRSSQYFTFLSIVLEKKSMMLPSNLQSVFLQYLSNFELKFKKYFPKIYPAMNGFAILLPNLLRRPLLNKKKKTILILSVIIP